MQGLRVNALGKYKTALQLVGISAMYVFRDEHHFFGSHMSGVPLLHDAFLYLCIGCT